MAAIVETHNNRVQVSLPLVDVYQSLQVISEGGNGQHYVVRPSIYELDVETQFAMPVFRTGAEKGLKATHAVVDGKIAPESTVD